MGETEEVRFDAEKLAALLRAKRGRHGLRDTAAEIGVSPSTLSRVEQGKAPDVDTLAKLCFWLGITPAELMPSLSSSPAEDLHRVELATPDRIEMHLRADKVLDKATIDALVTVVRLAYQAAERMRAFELPANSNPEPPPEDL
ncbi:MAG TPA: helix-turn-helix transcriptional regulator [Longimicrobiaceae bacterium]|nr:helix-turn-helix transcriptional regulator [Longimicrobiaceae bacterium]